MAKAVFHSFRGEKSALILVKANAFVFQGTPVYVPAVAIPEGTEEGDIIDIPDGYKFAPMLGEDGEPRTTEDGSATLQILVY